MRLPVSLSSTCWGETDELKVFESVCIGEWWGTLMESLDEMHLPLVLPGLGGLDGPAFSGEGHIPALILGILEGSVVVLQDDLCEDAVSASTAGLRNRKSI